MRVYRSIAELPADFGPCALTIGNFDGVHAGHRRIMRRLAEIAAANAWSAAVLTFNPHPAKIVAPSRAPKLITTPERRAEMMAEEGIEKVLILPFDAAVARWTPEQFVKDLLVDRLGVLAVLVGEDFRFGHKQAGDAHLLAQLGERYGFMTELIQPVSIRGKRVSSSLVRQAIASGAVSKACRLLERPFALEGRIVSGHGIGHKQTVPTLNLEPSSEVIPATGVYVTRTTDLGELHGARSWQSITNVGYRPTFDGTSLTIETFLLEPLAGPSPAAIRLEFLWRVREEKKFDSPEALKAQILRDAGRATTYFRRVLRAAQNRVSEPRFN